MYSNYIKAGILILCALCAMQLKAQQGVSVNKTIKFTNQVSPDEAKKVFLQKFNLHSKVNTKLAKNVYLDKSVNPLLFIEILFVFYFFSGILISK